MDRVAIEALQASFQAHKGSDQLATAFALGGLWRWLDHRRPRLVCEIGGGIGCLSAVLKAWCGQHAACAWVVEDNPWCREQWLAHVRAEPWFRLCERLPSHQWECVILDGPQVPPDLWEARLAPRAVVFVEGNRRDQRRAIREAFRTARRRACWASWRPSERSKGFHVAQTDPTALERLWFAGVRLREWVRDLPAKTAGRAVGKKAHP